MEDYNNLPSELTQIGPMSPVDTVAQSAPPNMTSFSFPTPTHDFGVPHRRRANTISKFPNEHSDYVSASNSSDFGSRRHDETELVEEDSPFSDLDGTHFERPNTPSPYESERHIPEIVISDEAGPVSTRNIPAWAQTAPGLDRPDSPESTTSSFSTASGFSSNADGPPAAPVLMARPGNWLQKNFTKRQNSGRDRTKGWAPKPTHLHTGVSVDEFEAYPNETQQPEQPIILAERRRSKGDFEQLSPAYYNGLKLYTTEHVFYKDEEKEGLMGPEGTVPQCGELSELPEIRSPSPVVQDPVMRAELWQKKRDEVIYDAWREDRRDRALFSLESPRAHLNRKIMALQYDLHDMTKERDEMREILKEAEREYRKLQNKLSETEASISKERAELQRKTVDFADISSFFSDESHAKYEAEKARADKLAADLEELGAKYATRSMEALSDEMRTKFEAEKTKSKRLEEDLDELEKRCSNSCMEAKGHTKEIEADLWASRGQYQNMLKEVNGLDDLNEELSNKLSQIEAEMQSLRSQLADERAAASDASKEVERLQNEAVEYQAEIVKLHKERENTPDSDALYNDLVVARLAIESLEEQLRISNGKANSLETKHELLRQQVESDKASRDLELDALREQLTIEHSASEAKQRHIEELEVELRALRQHNAKLQEEVERKEALPSISTARQSGREQRSLQEIVEKLESDNMRLRVRLTQHLEQFAPQLVGLNKANPTLQEKLDFLREKQQRDRVALEETIEKMKQEREAIAKQGEKLRKRRRELLGEDKESPKGGVLGSLR